MVGSGGVCPCFLMDGSSLREPHESGSTVVIIGQPGISRISEPAAQHRHASSPPTHTHTFPGGSISSLSAEESRRPGGEGDLEELRHGCLQEAGRGLTSEVPSLTFSEVWKCGGGPLSAHTGRIPVGHEKHFPNEHRLSPGPARQVQLPRIPRMGLCPDARAGRQSR